MNNLSKELLNERKQLGYIWQQMQLLLVISNIMTKIYPVMLGYVVFCLTLHTCASAE